MRILGHGIDVVSESRIAKLLESHERWAEGLFSTNERAIAAEAGRLARFYAGRYAAKEAVAKAMGTGFAEGVTVHGIDVLRLPSDAPVVRLSGGAKEMADRLGITLWLLSISHCGDLAMASAIAAGD
jgi:holo-[acyl-carrier protein] synthase